MVINDIVHDNGHSGPSYRMARIAVLAEYFDITLDQAAAKSLEKSEAFRKTRKKI